MLENPTSPAADSAIGGPEVLALGGNAAERSGGNAVRRGGRPAKKPKPKAAEMVRLHLAVSLECEQRLGVHCAITRESKNELCEKLLMAFLRDRGKGQGAFVGESPAPLEAKPADLSLVEIHSQARRLARPPGPLASRPDTREDRQDRTAS